MKKAKILSGALLLCFSSPLISQAATLDVRGGYRSGSHAYETRLKVSEGWQNGWWASMESNTWNTIHDNKKENAALNDVQVEVNYAIKLDDQWTEMCIRDSSHGKHIRIFTIRDTVKRHTHTFTHHRATFP